MLAPLSVDVSYAIIYKKFMHYSAIGVTLPTNIQGFKRNCDSKLPSKIYLL